MNHTPDTSLLIRNKPIEDNEDDDCKMEEVMEEGEAEESLLKAEIPGLLKQTHEAKTKGIDTELAIEAIEDIARACMKLIRANKPGLASKIEWAAREFESAEVIQPYMDEAVEVAMLEDALMDALSASDPPESEGNGNGKGKGKSKRTEPLLHTAVKRAAQRAQN
jgi:hypothetical protein